MKRMPYWIQRADFGSVDREAIDVERAIELVSGHDWPGELRLLDTLEAEGQESCAPGIGFVAAPGHILHICPARDGTASVHYHFSQRRKMLGFISGSRSVVRSESGVSFGHIREFIRRFYAGDHEWLCERTSAV